jgi:hypothetical protein
MVLVYFSPQMWYDYHIGDGDRKLESISMWIHQMA